MKPLDQLRTITQAYLTAVAFTDLHEDCEFESRTFADDTILKAASDCADFMRQAMSGGGETLFDRYTQLDWGDSPANRLEQFGHDFWLTRNGHGAGFWDRGLGKLGDDLSELAKGMGSQCAYEHDGLVYLE